MFKNESILPLIASQICTYITTKICNVGKGVAGTDNDEVRSDCFIATIEGMLFKLGVGLKTILNLKSSLF